MAELARFVSPMLDRHLHKARRPSVTPGGKLARAAVVALALMPSPDTTMAMRNLPCAAGAAIGGHRFSAVIGDTRQRTQRRISISAGPATRGTAREHALSITHRRRQGLGPGSLRSAVFCFRAGPAASSTTSGRWTPPSRVMTKARRPGGKRKMPSPTPARARCGACGFPHEGGVCHGGTKCNGPC